MKILWIYPELPFPLISGYLRGFHLLKHLGQRHTITFLCLTKQDRIPAETIPALKPYTDRVEIFAPFSAPHPRWQSLLERIPVLGWRMSEFWKTRWAIQQLNRAVQESLLREHFELVLFHGRSATHILDHIDIPIVVDCGDTNHSRIFQEMCLAPLLHRPRLLVHYLRQRYIETRLARKSLYRCFISARDRENLLGPFDTSEVVPQGVDCDYWRRRSPRSCGSTIVFSGVLSYGPNADAAEHLLTAVLPIVRRTLPHVRILIVGRGPSSKLKALAEQLPDVTITGTVDDVRPYLERADVFVAAIRFASGAQNKVLEAMAMELPVITTPVVLAGLRVPNVEMPLVIANGAEEIADAIINLLDDAAARERLAGEGRRFIESFCSWSHSAQVLEKLCFAAAYPTGTQIQAVSGDAVVTVNISLSPANVAHSHER